MSAKSHTLPGLIIAGFICLFVVASISALLFYSPGFNPALLWQDAYYRHVTKFSFYQAFLSTILSVGFAIPVAHALSRRHFFGKSFLLKLSSFFSIN